MPGLEPHPSYPEPVITTDNPPLAPKNHFEKPQTEPFRNHPETRATVEKE